MNSQKIYVFLINFLNFFVDCFCPLLNLLIRLIWISGPDLFLTDLFLFYPLSIPYAT